MHLAIQRAQQGEHTRRKQAESSATQGGAGASLLRWAHVTMVSAVSLCSSSQAEKAVAKNELSGESGRELRSEGWRGKGERREAARAEGEGGARGAREGR